LKKAKTWFEVDTKGLRALQAGKPKSFIINELVQNAFDEDITICKVNVRQTSDKDIIITVEDDSPEGFKNITHAYTLFADTYKRQDPTKRGRFNLGEKQVISICRYAIVKTTKGTVYFNDDGRTETEEHTDSGSVIEVAFKGTDKDYKEIIDHTSLLIPPQGVKYTVNNVEIKRQTVFKTFDTILNTEVLKNDEMVVRTRKTTITLYPSNGQSWIYEIGIPVMKTDCPWNIDIGQKAQLMVDRETIRPAYIQDLYAEVLNHTYQNITEDNVTSTWIDIGIKDERVSKDAVKGIIEKRFGQRVLIRNPFDGNANDEAISSGYTLVSGSQLSKEAWEKVRGFDILQSTTDKFGKTGIREAKVLEPTSEQRNYIKVVKKVGKELLGIDVKVNFVSIKGVPTIADFNPLTKEYRINLAHPSVPSFKTINWQNLKLMYHELPHNAGNHTETSYHDCITTLAGKLTMKAWKEKGYLEVN